MARPTKRDAGEARIARPLRPSPPGLASFPLRPSRQPCKHAPSACVRSFSESGWGMDGVGVEEKRLSVVHRRKRLET